MDYPLHTGRKKDGSEFSPDTLHHLCYGIQRFLRSNGHPALDIFKDSRLAYFRSSLDSEMKRLQSLGIGSKKKQSEPLTTEVEEKLWEEGLLGEHSPQTLLNTIIFMNGIYFALLSGQEHCNLCFHSSQIEIVEREDEIPYLQYTEDVSKNCPGLLKGRRQKPKVVQHHANVLLPSRCFVRLFKLYKSLCPPNPKKNTLYLQPLKKPTSTQWFSREPVGRNTISKPVSHLCHECGVKGFKTNHSLRVSTATRLYEAGMDEQLKME